MFKALDYARIQFARSVGALVSRPLGEEERAKTGRDRDEERITPANVAYEWIRMELKQHESLWHIEAAIGVRHIFSASRDDPLGQRPLQEEPALVVEFCRLGDGARKYMLTFAGEATEIATIEEVIERIKSLYARALVEGTA